MTGTDPGDRRLIQAVRNRVRLRSRLRRIRDVWRRQFPRRLPRWAAPPAATTAPVTAAPVTPWLVDGEVVVDPATANPRGRHRYGPPLATGELRLPGGGGCWEIVRESDRVLVVAGLVGQPLDQRQSAVLAALAGVTAIEGPAPAAPALWGHLLAQLAMTGLPLAPASASRGDGIAAALADLLAQPLPGPAADPMAWEIRSVQQRRLAIRHHAGLARPPAVSALLVTKRPQLLPTAVAALAAQSYPELEIVIGVHGGPAPAPADLPTAGRPVRIVPVPASRNLGEALAAATAAATGEVVTKVDDDDRYGPEHIWDLVLARHYSGATVTGKGAAFVYLEPKDLTVRRRMAAEADTDTVAGGTIMLDPAALAAAGGWPPVPRSVDRALLDAVIAAGGNVYRTHPLGFVYTRHGDGHTWDPGLDYFLRDPLRTWPGLPPYHEFAAQGGGGTGPA